MNPSYKYHIQYTNQIFEDGEWKFVNRYIGKFGARPIVWYDTKEWAEKFMKEDDEVAEIEMVEWDGIDEEGYKNVYKPPQINEINK
jgi:hypothetical protein